MANKIQKSRIRSVEHMESKDINRRNKNKIYFLIAVILALLSINGYMFFKNKQQPEKVVSTNTSIEKEQLKLEIEKVELELDRVNTLNLNLSKSLILEQETAREKIEQLKAALRKGVITKIELDQAYSQIGRLKAFIKNYNIQIASLRGDSSLLTNSRDNLKRQVRTIATKMSKLKDENIFLSEKVKTASELKLNTAAITAFKTRSSGKKVDVTRSSTAETLSIKFNILPNELAEKRLYHIFLRVFDPAGNLIADESNRFVADGQEMQFSHSINIDYNNDNSIYTIDWKNPQPFIKGIYTVILYTEGNTLGKAQISLR